MSIQALDWAFKQNGFSVPATKLVLIALANYADERNTCYPSQAKLASICSLGRRSIITHLQRLRDEGFITWHRTRGSDGRATTNTYQLLIDRKNPPFVDPDMSNFRDESGSEHDIENGPETPCANIAHGRDHVQPASPNRVQPSAHSHVQPTAHSHVQPTAHLYNKEDTLIRDTKEEIHKKGSRDYSNLEQEPESRKKIKFAHPFSGTLPSKPITLSASENEIRIWLDAVAGAIGVGCRENLASPLRWREVVEKALRIGMDIPTMLRAVTEAYDCPTDQVKFITPEKIYATAVAMHRSKKSKPVQPVSTMEEKLARYKRQSALAPKFRIAMPQ